MAYERQYTQGVGWENTPSINTPISAENLNQMDEAIQDVDEAAYTEFLAVYAAIAQAGGGNAVNFYIDNASNNTLASTSSVLADITLKKDDIIFLYMSVDGDYTQAQTGWKVEYKMYVGGTLTTLTAVIRDYLHGEGAMFHDAFNLDLARGTWLILRVVDTTHFDCIGKIDPASSGGGSISYYSDATETVDDGNIYTDRNIFHGYTPSAGDMLFLRVDVDAHKTSGTSYPWYVVYGTAQSSVGDDQIYDARSAFATIAFWQDIAAGSTLIMNYDGQVWDLRAVIPASGGSGASTLAALTDTNITTPTDTQALKYDVASSKWKNVDALGEAYNFKIDSASNDTLIPVVMQRTRSKPFAKNDIIFLYMDTDGVFVPEEYVYRWMLQYTLNNTAITGDIYNGLGSSAISLFNTNLPRGTWLVLLCDAYNSEYHTQHYTCIGKIDPASGGGASTLADLTDTNIVTPSNGQLLTYDSTSGKWINASAGGGTGVLTYEIVTKSTGGTSAAVTVNKYVNKSRKASTDYLYSQAQTPVTIDDKIVLDYGATASGKWTYRLLEASQDHAVGYSDSWAYSATVSKTEDYESQDNPDTLDAIDDVNLTFPFGSGQPITFDATSGKWANGGVIPIANGGTGNADGYIQTGIKANTVAATRSTIEGIDNTTSGVNSHVEGISNTISAGSSQAHAEGGQNTVSGQNAHAEGGQNKATANQAHAEGYGTTASGQNSHTQNTSTTASAASASAAGSYTTAGYASQFVIGKYNNNKSTNIFEVGIGANANAKANGLELDTSGNLKVAGTITDGNGNELNKYLEQTVTLSTSASTTVTFTDSSITANSFIEYACSQWDLVPESITGAAGSCTIVLPKVDSAQSVTVRIYVR